MLVLRFGNIKMGLGFKHKCAHTLQHAHLAQFDSINGSFSTTAKTCTPNDLSTYRPMQSIVHTYYYLLLVN